MSSLQTLRRARHRRAITPSGAPKGTKSKTDGIRSAFDWQMRSAVPLCRIQHNFHSHSVNPISRDKLRRRWLDNRPGFSLGHISQRNGKIPFRNVCNARWVCRYTPQTWLRLQVVSTKSSWVSRLLAVTYLPVVVDSVTERNLPMSDSTRVTFHWEFSRTALLMPLVRRSQ